MKYGQESKQNRIRVVSDDKNAPKKNVDILNVKKELECPYILKRILTIHMNFVHKLTLD